MIKIMNIERRRPGDWTESEQRMIEELRPRGVSVGVVMHPPWAYPCAMNNPPCANPGIGIEFTKTLCDRIEISCSFLPMNMTEIEVEGNVQQSMVNMINSGEVDTCLPLLSETNEYRQYLDFSMPMFYFEGGAMVKTQFTYSSDLFFVLKPFDSLVWVYLGLLLCAVGLWDCCCRVALQYPTGIRGWIYGFWRFADHSILQNLGLLLQRGVNIEAKEMSRRVLLLTWGLASIWFCGIYSAFIVSHRVAAKVQNPFANIPELTKAIATDKMQLWIDLSSAGLLRSLSQSPDGMFRELNESLQNFQPTVFLNVSHRAVIPNLLQSEKPVALYSSLYTLKAIGQNNCNVTIIPLQIVDMGSFAFRKGTGYANLFTKLILNFKDKGYYLEHLEQKYRFGRACEGVAGSNNNNAGSEANQIQVTVSQMQAVIYFILLGGAIGMSVCCLELFYYRTVHQPSVRALVARSLNLQLIRAAIVTQQTHTEPYSYSNRAETQNGYSR